MRQNKRVLSTRIVSLICLIVIIAVILTVIFFGIAYKPRYIELINNCSKTVGVDPLLVSAIMRQESKFKSDAVSNKGAVGLMQLMPTTAEWIAKKHNIKEYDLYNPKDNVLLSAFYLKYLDDKYNNIQHVVVAYNAGEGRVDNWLKIIDGELIDNLPYEETQDYYCKVMRNYKVYQVLQ